MKSKLRWILPIFFGLLLTGTLGVRFLKERNQTIIIQPFNGFPISLVKIVHTNLQSVYPDVIIKSAIPLPSSAYFPARNRYRADKLIAFLKNRHGGDTVVIGLTEKDISVTKGKYPDWGVMGFGYRPGGSCVVSTFRISKRKQSEQLVKLSLHELGHTQGLPHCSNTTCYMRDAEGRNVLDQQNGFCVKCTTVLKLKGWKI